MKPSMIGGIAGAALGAIVAVEAHFISRTLPSSITLSRPYADYESARQLPAIPEVHPSWWPVLPIAVAVGLIVGLLVAPLWRQSAAHRVGIAWWPIAGAALGALLAMLAHVVGHTLASTYYAGFVSDGSQTLDITVPKATVSPSWLWSLPISLAVGLLLGLAAAFVQHRRARSEPVLV